jgi:hypothetical protein
MTWRKSEMLARDRVCGTALGLGSNLLPVPDSLIARDICPLLYVITSLKRGYQQMLLAPAFIHRKEFFCSLKASPGMPWPNGHSIQLGRRLIASSIPAVAVPPAPRNGHPRGLRRSTQAFFQLMNETSPLF